MASEGFPKLVHLSVFERLSVLVRRSDSDDPPHPRKKPTSLLYDVDDNPPLLVRLGASIQHVLLMSVGWLYIVVIVNAAGGTEAQAQDLMRMSMIAAGLATILQGTRGILGSGYLCPLSSSLTYLPSSILAVRTAGFSLLLGMVAFAGATTGILSRMTRHLRILFPPEVTGLMVCMSGLQLIAIGCPRFVGYVGPGSVPHFRTVLIGMVTLVAMVAATVWNRGKLHVLPLLVGLIFGYGLSLAFGNLPWNQFLRELSEPWVSLPHRVTSGLSFRFSLVVPFLIACVTANLKTVGDLTLCQKINDADWKRTDMKSISGGLLASGFGTFFSGLSGGVAQNTVSSSIGLSLATGTTSRSIALPAGLAVIALAFFPKIAAVLVAMPAPVVGAMLIYSACFIVIGGLQLLTSRMLDARRIFAVGISFIFGLSVDISPDLYREVPEFLRPVFSSSVAFATILVISLSLLFRLGIASKIKFQVQPGPTAFDTIHFFMEEQGAAWGMRREVAMRAEHAMNEVANSAYVLNPGLKALDVTLAFNELKLDATIDYEGTPIQIVESAPSIEELGTDQGIAALSTFMIRQYVDRVKVKTRKGVCSVLIQLDH
ncbi:MAG TPA: solute carrier family 23 protein [Candidatus Acidoferrum sp.]|nr:solute carrier family 23 protein [Candidatus Acidoferrum sp.]